MPAISSNRSDASRFVGRLMMTMATVLYGIAPLIVDLTESHVFHPGWTPHSRFHMVWLLSTDVAIAALALFYIWSKSSNSSSRLMFGGLLGICVFGGFFVSAATMSLYGGALADVGGVKPVMGIDLNLLGFSLELALLLGGMFLARPAHP